MNFGEACRAVDAVLGKAHTACPSGASGRAAFMVSREVGAGSYSASWGSIARFLMMSELLVFMVLGGAVVWSRSLHSAFAVEKEECG